MKKLLLLGALLTIGATSFAENQTITGTLPTSSKYVSLGTVSQQGEKTKAGEAKLNLVAKGNVIAASANEYILVIRPTVTSEVNSDSIVFNFGDMTPGETKKMIGGYIAQVITSTDGTNQQLLDLTGKEDFFSSKFMVGTEDKGLAVNDLTVIASNNDGNPDPDGNTTAVEIGDLSYRVSPSFDGKYSYVGEIEAEMVVLSTATAATFRNSAADIVVSVKEGLVEQK